MHSLPGQLKKPCCLHINGIGKPLRTGMFLLLREKVLSVLWIHLNLPQSQYMDVPPLALMLPNTRRNVLDITNNPIGK